MKPRISTDWSTLQALRHGGLDDLLTLHWEEVGEAKDAAPLAVDWEALRMLEHAGILRCIGAWRGLDLIGYAAFELCRPRFSHRTYFASETGLYVVPEERGFVGLALVRKAEELLLAEGVKLVQISSRPSLPVVGDLLAKLGYRPTETIHTKVLG